MHEQLMQNSKRLQAFFSFVFLLLIMFSLLTFVRLKHKHAEVVERERQLRLSERKKNLLSLERVEQNERRIAELEKLQEQARNQQKEGRAEELQLESELLQSENKSIEAMQKTLSYNRQLLKSSDVYHKIIRGSGKSDIRLSDEEWDRLGLLIDNAYNDFTYRLLELSELSREELQVCYLVKLGISPTSISKMLFVTPAAVSMNRKRMFHKLTKKAGTAPMFDTFIQNF